MFIYISLYSTLLNANFLRVELKSYVHCGGVSYFWIHNELSTQARDITFRSHFVFPR